MSLAKTQNISSLNFIHYFIIKRNYARQKKLHNFNGAHRLHTCILGHKNGLDEAQLK